VDECLRRFCGWPSRRALPHESKFSRAFDEFARTELPQQLHEAVIAATQQQRLIVISPAIRPPFRSGSVIRKRRNRRRRKLAEECSALQPLLSL